MAAMKSWKAMREFSRALTYLKARCQSAIFINSDKRSISFSHFPLRNQEVPNILQTSAAKSNRAAKISKAMRAYLEQAQKQEEFMKTEIAEYEIGKRHLANMMGVDPEMFTQADIDEAIEYLMPSGLFDPKARPMMKHPKEIFPKQKAAQFDKSGRPFHYLYYTCKPNYYQILHEIAEKLNGLNKFEDSMIKKGVKNPEAELQIKLGGSEWISRDALEKLVLESVREDDHAYFVSCMERLAHHPYSSHEKDFIMQFCKKLVAETKIMEIPQLMFEKTGRPYMDGAGTRKSAKANVRIWGKGTGKVNINGTDISYFSSLQDREQIMFPLHLTGLLDTVDIEATVENSGHTAQAGAVRHGISLALRSFLKTEEVELMRQAGLLTRDPRIRERKKPGQKGARAKYTWKKR